MCKASDGSPEACLVARRRRIRMVPEAGVEQLGLWSACALAVAAALVAWAVHVCACHERAFFWAGELAVAWSGLVLSRRPPNTEREPIAGCVPRDLDEAQTFSPLKLTPTLTLKNRIVRAAAFGGATLSDMLVRTSYERRSLHPPTRPPPTTLPEPSPTVTVASPHPPPHPRTPRAWVRRSKQWTQPPFS